MCPYEPKHVKGNTKLQKRWDISQKLSYNVAMNKIGIPMIGLGTWLIPNDEVEQNISGVGEISYNELTVEQKVSCLFENIDNDFLLANSIYKIDNSKAIDNYSISVDIEVI